MVQARFSFPSRSLGRNMEFYVLLPKLQSPFLDAEAAMDLGHKKTLWFFHGVGDDAGAVLSHTDMASLCDAHDLVVILPSIENSFGLNVNGSMRFRSYLLDELIPYVTRVFSLSEKRENRLIGGISMGGYAACSIGLSRPELFSRITCLSGALDLRSASRFARACEIPLAAELLEKDALKTHPGWDLFSLLAGMAGREDFPPIRLVCSELDSIFPGNLRFRESAAALGLPVELHTAPGLHDWKFWRENLPEAVAWAAGGGEKM